MGSLASTLSIPEKTMEQEFGVPRPGNACRSMPAERDPAEPALKATMRRVKTKARYTTYAPAYHFLQPPLSSLPLSRFPKLNISLWFLVTSCASLSSKCAYLAYLEIEQSPTIVGSTISLSFLSSLFFENDHPSREIVNRPGFLFVSFFSVQNLRIFFLFRQMSNDKCRMINRQESSSCSFLLPPRGWRLYRETRGSNVKKWMLWEINSGILDSFFIELTSSSNNKFFLFEIQTVFHIPYSWKKQQL